MKKKCPHCGRELELDGFYMNRKDGTLSSWCKDCMKQNKREWYARERRVPDGIRYDAKTGRSYEHRGLSRRIHWSRRMLDDLRRLFATTKNDDLADIIGVSPRTVVRKARELGLEKDKQWQHGNVMSHLMMAKFESRRLGYPGQFRKGEHFCPEHEFRKGHVESGEQKARRVASLKEWCRRHPLEVKERARKASEARKRNKLIKENAEQLQSRGQQ